MNIPTSEPILPDDPSLPPARRRRQKRSLLPDQTGDKTGLLEALAHQVTPAFDFFLSTLLSGLILGAALIFDAPALFLLAVLFAPFLGPVAGLSLATVVGSVRFFLTAMASLFVAGLILFGCGALAGVIAQQMAPGKEFIQPIYHMFFSWPDSVVLVIGAGLTIYMLVQSPRQRPLIPNLALAYTLFLPLGTAGFLLTNGSAGLWLNGINVFLVHLATAALVGAAMVLILGLRPATIFGYTLITMIILFSVVGIGLAVGLNEPPQLPNTEITQSAMINPTLQPVEGLTSQPVVTDTPQPLVKTLTPTNTLIPSPIPSKTVTPLPTPVWARVASPQGDGAFVRSEPGGTILTSLINGSPVQVISEPVVTDGGTIWVKILTENNQEGWIMQSLLATATPSAGW